jgi:nicotinamide phosphoribosyltransferase
MTILHLTDGYKVDHRSQYPRGTTKVRSNWTPRSSRIPGIDRVVFFGLQYFIEKYLVEEFEAFFNMPRTKAVKSYQKTIESYLGVGAITFEHIEALYDLQYLPVRIEAACEGESVPLRTPMLFIENTLPDFFWLTNYLETLLSATLWLPCTSATTAARFKKLFMDYAKLTGGPTAFVNWQGHDFSFRGMGSVESAILSGMAHLTSFTGTDTIPAIPALIKYYDADPESLIGGSVPATEHSVMCMGEQEHEQETFRRLIEDVYPTGIVSIVSDSWDYWKVLTEYLPNLKEKILSRSGKVVIRPDSGDPVKIVCGDSSFPLDSPQELGSVEVLWDLFGGYVNANGYRELDSHIGLIYGDGINYERARDILINLEHEGLASTNVVFGIGSYTYQYVTRDTFGFAVKATYGEINEKPVSIFKNPKTDDGGKKSAKGLIRIRRNAEGLIEGHEDGIPPEDYTGSGYPVVFENGSCNRISFAEVRKNREKEL